MENTSLIDLSDLPAEIQQHIANYLDAPALNFFAQSNKQALKNALPRLRNYQAQFHLLLTANGSSSYLAHANQFFVCGDNCYGQLGLGDNQNRAILTRVLWPAERGSIQQVIAGWNHTLVLTENNQLWGCGRNDFGQLGLGDNENRAIFTAVPWPAERGIIRQVISSWAHTIVLTQDNQLWVCGYNVDGQLGLGDNQNRAVFTNFTRVPWPVERGIIRQVITSVVHTLVLTQDNQLWVCGNNEEGQLGLGNNQNRAAFTAVPWPAERSAICQIIAGRSYTLVLTKDSQLWVCGNNGSGQLGLGNNHNRATFTAVLWPAERSAISQIIAGRSYTLVLTKDSQLWVCGENQFGQLGLGDNQNRAIFTKIPWPEERGRIKQVVAGGYATIVFIENNQLWACGKNDNGQLGLGDDENRSSFTLVQTLPDVIKQVFMLNDNLNQLITLGTVLTLTPSTKFNTFYTQPKPDNQEMQPPQKAMRL